MSGRDDSVVRRSEQRAGWIDEVQRGFAEFLTVPGAVIGAFLLLAVVTQILDRADIGWLTPMRALLRDRVFSNPQATADLLSTIASSLVTVTSITFSLLLIAVQQAAGSLTFQVIDQFLRRRVNQGSFGFFVGLALYALIVLATVDPPFNPVFGATLALLLAAVALVLLLALLYTTVNQMRPVEIIETIHDHTLAARERQLELVRRCRPVAVREGPFRAPVSIERHGFVAWIDVDRIAAGAERAGGEVEVVLHVSIGSYVAVEDRIAEIRASAAEDAAALVEPVRAAIRLRRQRDLGVDPAYGIEQLVNIAWTSVSTSKQNPAPGLLTVRSLRDILARWSSETEDESVPRRAPVVYIDTVFEDLLQAFETLIVVSSESLQHQVFAEIARTFAVMFDRLPAEQQPRAEDLICRSLSALGEHVLTAELDAALAALDDALVAADRPGTARAVRTARARLGESIGKLGARSTRVPDRP